MRVAGQIVILSAGSVVQCGPVEEVYHQPASLAAALALGPASEVSGIADGGLLMRDAVAAVEGIDPKRRGLARLILRPADVEFVEDPAGPAVVVGLEWSAGAYSLNVAAAGATVLVCHDRRAALGARGRLRLARACPAVS
jgi:ABC-type sulfate/molybdate transport systems ATPase subunit